MHQDSCISLSMRSPISINFLFMGLLFWGSPGHLSSPSLLLVLIFS